MSAHVSECVVVVGTRSCCALLTRSSLLHTSLHLEGRRSGWQFKSTVVGVTCESKQHFGAALSQGRGHDEVRNIIHHSRHPVAVEDQCVRGVVW